jgi:hypothetical protein
MKEHVGPASGLFDGFAVGICLSFEEEQRPILTALPENGYLQVKAHISEEQSLLKYGFQIYRHLLPRDQVEVTKISL